MLLSTFSHKEVAQPSSISYLLGSIMSQTFLDSAKFKHMLDDVSKENSCVTVCGDEIYRVTAPFLFGEKAKTDQIVRKREKFVECYNQHKSPSTQLVFWGKFYRISEYQQFKKFTSALLDPELTLDKLQVTFPTAEPTRLESLLGKREELSILGNVDSIARGFEGKNIKRLKRQAKRSVQKTKELVEVMEQIFGVASNSDPTQQALDQCMDGLRLATHQFLADEYAVFLLLMYMTDKSSIVSHLGITLPESISSTVCPRLFYPIDATPGANLTFETFSRVCDIYTEYHQDLGLPTVNIINIENIYIPEELRDKKSHESSTHAVKLETGSDTGSDSHDELAQSNHRLPEESEMTHSSLEVNSAQKLLNFTLLLNAIIDMIKFTTSGSLRECTFDIENSLKFLLQVFPRNTTPPVKETDKTLDDLSKLILNAFLLASLGVSQELNFDYGSCTFTAKFFSPHRSSLADQKLFSNNLLTTS